MKEKKGPKLCWQQRAHVMIKAARPSQHRGSCQTITAPSTAQPQRQHPVFSGGGVRKGGAVGVRSGSDLHLVCQVNVINQLLGLKTNITVCPGPSWKPLVAQLQPCSVLHYIQRSRTRVFFSKSTGIFFPPSKIFITFYVIFKRLTQRDLVPGFREVEGLAGNLLKDKERLKEWSSCGWNILQMQPAAVFRGSLQPGSSPRRSETPHAGSPLLICSPKNQITPPMTSLWHHDGLFS